MGVRSQLTISCDEPGCTTDPITSMLEERKTSDANLFDNFGAEGANGIREGSGTADQWQVQSVVEDDKLIFKAWCPTHRQ